MVDAFRHLSVFNWLTFVFVAHLSMGCVTSIPVEEYVMARTAYEAAKHADSPRFASALWYSAEHTYRQGEKLFRDRDYNAARERFEKAREFAEQAENLARLARFQTGDYAP